MSALGSVAPGRDAKPVAANIVTHGEGLDAALLDTMRERMAERLGLDVRNVRPCVAAIRPQEEGRRGEFCRVLAVELLRAGASKEVCLAYLGGWAEDCCQPPRASQKFAPSEVASIVKSALKTQRHGGLRGYGCKTGPLAEICPYGGGTQGMGVCPSIAQRRRPAKRERIATLPGAWNLARQHMAPLQWTGQQTVRRRFLMMAIAALEVGKNYGGGQLFTSVRELAYQTGIPRSTVARDLVAMRDAGWVEYEPGRNRREPGDLPRGARIRRLLPGELWDALAREAFPEATEEVS